MNRLLVIPAAGRGSRLGGDVPKALFPVLGRPMIGWLYERYEPFVDMFVVVASPSAQPAILEHARAAGVRTATVVQKDPRGMLPAVLCAKDMIGQLRPAQVWITWCDQVGIGPSTAGQLARELDQHSDAALIFPTVRKTPPYVHFVRDRRRRIIGVLHSREGDPMPESGESDAGLFGLSLATYLDDLPVFAAEASIGAATRELNFLPFIPWLAARRPVQTFEIAGTAEVLGINTAADLAAMEQYLRERA